MSNQDYIRKPLNNFSPLKSTINNNNSNTSSSIFLDSSNTSTTNSSPKKTSSSRVIESLHNEIDQLKLENLKLKNSNDELKKANELITNRRNQLLEQLSNSKHENETINSLLQRKQRRINDLEDSLNDVSNKSDDINMKFQSLKTRCDKLMESESHSTAEYERIKIAYETIVSSQREYREFYSNEIKNLKEKLNNYIELKDSQINKNFGLVNKSDATIFRSLKSITLRSQQIEDQTNLKNKLLSDSILKLESDYKLETSKLDCLYKKSQEIFDRVAIHLNIEKEELIDNFNKQFDPIDPNIILKSNQIQPKEIKIKKRNDRKSSTKSQQQNRTISVEERISSLTKELNSVIPASDRVTSLPTSSSSITGSAEITTEIPTIKRSKSLKVDQSRRSSALFESTPSSSTNTSDVSQNLDSKYNNNLNITDGDLSNDLKKKRRRRRRRKNKNFKLVEDEIEDSDNQNQDNNDNIIDADEGKNL
ncbi:hypothetical protein WICMUC_000506 [Wickerhamomyces mucosus]|uniref:SWI5-dependent HO expression protein 3 n=1 Tax=Wickerhamomyces mucosus TaxID=1378264 RepID=A0A9P8TIQ1_9ASCO|nr:hypothetical protein WICMUC_000506 [Wickerhamomyces mucosus]